MKMIEFQDHDDMVDIKSVLQEDAESDLDQVLEYCVEHDLKIKMDDQAVDAVWLIQVKKFFIEQHYRSLRKSQTCGIKRALKDKAAGKASYGRPKVELPDDFEDQVISRVRRKEPLAAYCRQLDMKKSTFYNCVHICLRESEKGDHEKRG